MTKLNATQIKVIAIIAMTIDHIAELFVPYGSALYYIMRLIGKITAPVMCYFLAEGFRYTHDKKKYILRLSLFAAISQPAYYILVYGAAPSSTAHLLQNLNFLFSLLLAFICLLILTNSKLNAALKVVFTVITISFTQFVDWGLIIPVWTIIFFFFNKDIMKMTLLFISTTLIILPVTFLKLYDSFGYFTLNYGALLALILILLYNGKRERCSTPLKKKINRWFFYVYYPLHMIIISVIAYK
ncbi:MAG: hypothetical protein IKW90_15935 [Lachnospiraceae bacterium]|nr:hypothetical protein [Lachnospiraceae bacterium]